MKFNHLLAFLLTLIAILVLVSGLVAKYVGIVIFSSDCTSYSVLLFPDENKVDAEVGQGNLVKLRVINAGSYSDNYEVSLEGPDWTIIKPTSFSLKPEQAKILFLYVSPDFEAEGKYDIVVHVKSKCVSASQSVEVSVLKE